MICNKCLCFVQEGSMFLDSAKIDIPRKDARKDYLHGPWPTPKVFETRLHPSDLLPFGPSARTEIHRRFGDLVNCAPSSFTTTVFGMPWGAYNQASRWIGRPCCALVDMRRILRMDFARSLPADQQLEDSKVWHLQLANTNSSPNSTAHSFTGVLHGFQDLSKLRVPSLTTKPQEDSPLEHMVGFGASCIAMIWNVVTCNWWCAIRCCGDVQYGDLNVLRCSLNLMTC